MQSPTFTSFKDMARYVQEQDVKKAQQLARSASLRKGKVRGKTGPAIAR